MPPFSPSNQPSVPNKDAFSDSAVLSLRTLRILFVAMFLSVVLYALIGTFIPGDIPRSVEGLQLTYKIISFAGGLCVAGLLLIRNLMNRDPGPALTETESAGPPGISPARVLSNRRLSLVAFVVSEMIALLGLIFVFLGGPRRTLYIFCAISLACLILFFPKETS
jgi:hypothetical protein